MSKKKSKIYCSIGEVPAGQKLGTMKECALKKQIRYYGIKKIDPKLLEFSKKGSGPASQKDRDNAAIKMAGLRGKVNKFKKMLDGAKTEKDKKQLKKDLDNATKEFKEVSAQFIKLDKALKKGGSRRKSKRKSRGSKKKLII